MHNQRYKLDSIVKVVTYCIKQVTHLANLLLIIISCFHFSTAFAASAPSVVFLNPGEASDLGKGAFWPNTSKMMTIAANNFGMHLEVLYAERNHLLMLQQAEEIAKRPIPPDYVFLTNEKQIAPKLMEILADLPSKIILIHNDLTAEQRRQFGNERDHFTNWIGTVTTDGKSAAYRMMKELYRQIGDKEPQIIGITGDRSTPVSLERLSGVENFLSDAGHGTQLQVVYCDWSVEDAKKKAEVLLARYPQSNIIWAANYAMAYGALLAVKELDVDVLVGTMATAPDSQSSMLEHGIPVTLGSNFFIGVWAMVMLHDYHNGEDFINHGGVKQKLDYLTLINSSNATRYFKMIGDDLEMQNFSQFSKFEHPSSGKYEFSIETLMGGN